MKYLYQNKHWSINKEYNLDKLLYLMVDRPNYINVSDYFWLNDKNQCHRDYDLPSHYFVFINNNNEKCNLYWYKNDIWHRENNKPAYVYNDKLNKR